MRLLVLPLSLVLASCQCRAEFRHESAPVPSNKRVDPKPIAPEEPKPPATVSSHTLTIGTGAGTLDNVRLAAASIDGLVVKAGSRFSFNEVVGQRTAERGYKVATTLFEGAETKDLGGGVCQVSTALYVALMYGGYKVLERHPHSTPRPYAWPGMDSSINWPDLDLRFENDDSHDVTIRAKVEGQDLTVTLESPKEPPTVNTWWVEEYPKPFETRHLKSQQASKPYTHRKGREGTPGIRVWYYRGGQKLHVRSEYKPVLEVVIVPAG